MSALEQNQARMSEAEYLEFERANETKHEYFNGETFAMAGASEAHSLICTSLTFLLYGQLRQRPCKVYGSDTRVKVLSTGLYTYPDISVVCGDAIFTGDKPDTLINPNLVIEVLSPSTERNDRGRKFQHFSLIPSLQEYVLVAQDSPRIERFLRQNANTWQYLDIRGLTENIKLNSIDCILSLSDVYEKIDLSSDISENSE